MKRICSISIILMLLLISTTACTPNQQSGQSSDTNTQPETKPQNVHLNMATPEQTSSNFLFAVAVAESVAKGTDGRISISAVESPSSTDNIRKLRRGDHQLAYTNTDGQLQAYTATGSFSDEEPYKELRMLFSYSVLPKVLAVRENAGIESIYDLHGQPFSPGPGGSETARICVEALGILGIEPKIVYAETPAAVEMVKNREIVGYFKPASGLMSPDATFTDINTLLPLKVLSFTEEEMDILLDNMLMTPITIPAGVYPNQTEPIHTSASVACFAALSSLDEQIVYEITKSVFENKDIQIEALKSVAEVDYASLTLDVAPIPLHAGTYRYFKEMGFDVPQDLIPPEAK